MTIGRITVAIGSLWLNIVGAQNASPALSPVKPPTTMDVQEQMCSQDVFECPDGSFVGRVPPDCVFQRCPEAGSGPTPRPTPGSTPFSVVTFPGSEHDGSSVVLCEDRPFQIGFIFTGGECQGSSNSQSEDAFLCQDYNEGLSSMEEVYITVTGSSLSSGLVYYFQGIVRLGEKFNLLDDWNTFVDDQEIHIYKKRETEDPENLLQYIKYGSSCSESLYLGDSFGGVQLIEFTNEKQGMMTYLYELSHPNPDEVDEGECYLQAAIECSTSSGRSCDSLGPPSSKVCSSPSGRPSSVTFLLAGDGLQMDIEKYYIIAEARAGYAFEGVVKLGEAFRIVTDVDHPRTITIYSTVDGRPEAVLRTINGIYLGCSGQENEDITLLQSIGPLQVIGFEDSTGYQSAIEGITITYVVRNLGTLPASALSILKSSDFEPGFEEMVKEDCSTIPPRSQLRMPSSPVFINLLESEGSESSFVLELRGEGTVKGQQCDDKASYTLFISPPSSAPTCDRTIVPLYPTSEPTLSPSMALPTMAPTAVTSSTAAEEPSSNDECPGALPIQIGSTGIFGDTTSATWDGKFVPSFCDAPDNLTPGIWYKFTGNGELVVAASTCDERTNFDTALSVYKGFCTNLTCVGGNDDFHGNCQVGVGGLSSQVSFTTEPGVEYFILVHGYAGTGQFGFSLGEGRFYTGSPTSFGTNGPTSFYTGYPTSISSSTLSPSISPAPTPEPPSNDECYGAITINVGDTDIYGDTSFATSDGTAVPSFCGAPESNTPGIWYMFMGTGGTVLAASTCDEQTNFDTALSVYKGSCDRLICVAGNDDVGDACEFGAYGVSSQVTFITEPGVQYFILVHGFSWSGQFGLSLYVPPTQAPTLSPAPTMSPTPMMNDECSGAIPIYFGDPIHIGDTNTATWDGDSVPSFCGAPDNGTPGIWYQFAGTGGSVVVASTCDDVTNFDTALSVYKGSCNNLICVGGNDDAGASCQVSGLSSQVTITTEPGVEYFILVHGYNGAGQFGIALTAIGQK